jgi:hypothetical protein
MDEKQPLLLLYLKSGRPVLWLITILRAILAKAVMLFPARTGSARSLKRRFETLIGLYRLVNGFLESTKPFISFI